MFSVRCQKLLRRQKKNKYFYNSVVVHILYNYVNCIYSLKPSLITLKGFKQSKVHFVRQGVYDVQSATFSAIFPGVVQVRRIAETQKKQ